MTPIFGAITETNAHVLKVILSFLFLMKVVCFFFVFGYYLVTPKTQLISLGKRVPNQFETLHP